MNNNSFNIKEQQLVITQDVLNKVANVVIIVTDVCKEMFNLNDEQIKSLDKELTKSYIKGFIKSYANYQPTTEVEKYDIQIASSGGIPVNDIKVALIAADVSRDGKLPLGKNFLTYYEEGVIERQPKEEFDFRKQKIENRLEFVAKWIKNNPDTDPNLYEMMELNIDVANCLGKISERAKDNYRYINQKRIPEMISKMGINHNDPIYELYIGSYDFGLEGVPITVSSNMKSLLCKLGGIYGYIKQQIRDHGISNYDNTEELNYVKYLLVSTKQENIKLPNNCLEVIDNIVNDYNKNMNFPRSESPTRQL
jgi:hypothetical protein